MEHPRIVDLLRIVTLVQGHRRLDSAQLAEKLGKTQRSIFRDLKVLREAGIPIAYDRKDRSFRLEKGYHMPPVHLTPAEALAISALCEHVAEGAQVPFLRPAWEAAHKLLSSMPESIVNDVAGQSRHIAIRTGPSMPDEGHGDVYGKVQEALRTRRGLECRYDAASEVRGRGAVAKRRRSDSGATFRLEPYSLLFSVRAWYVIGRRDDRDELRCMRLSRFSRMVLTDHRYHIPDSFSLDSYLGNAWRMMPGDRDEVVELHFDAEVGPTVAETRWHRTQRIDERPDGSCTFRCTVSGFDEIVWWILGYGPHCRVVRPIGLRTRVREMIERMAHLYDDQKPLTPRLSRGDDARPALPRASKRKTATG